MSNKMSKSEMWETISDRWADKSIIDRDRNVATYYYFLGASASDGVIVVQNNIRSTANISIELA